MHQPIVRLVAGLALVCLLAACVSGESPVPTSVSTPLASVSSPTLAATPLASLTTTAPATQPSVIPAATAATAPGLPPSPTPNALPVPSDPAAAATYLAERAGDVDNGPAAVAEILTRSGIPIRAADTGRLLNNLNVPADIDVYVYDFELSLLANGVRDERGWTLKDLSEYASAMGLNPAGQPVPPVVLGAALTRWLKNAQADPGALGAFAPLAIRALGLRRKQPQDLAAGADPATTQLDPLQFALLSSSLLSRMGSVENTGSAAAATPSSGAGAVCDQLKASIDDPTGIIKKYSKESFQQGLKDYIKDELGQNAADALDAAFKALDMAGDGLSIGLLLAGIRINVTDDAQPTHGNAHYAHKDFAPENFYHYIATLRFDSPFPDTFLKCAGLAGVKLPPNGPLPGWKIKWQLEQQDRRHVAPVSSKGVNESSKLDTSGGGGELSDGQGQSKLQVEVAEEAGCPDEPSCGKGPIKLGTATGIACPDTTDLPLKLADLLPGLDGTYNPAKPAGKLILDMLKRMALPCARDTVFITRHQPATFQLTIRSTGDIQGPDTTFHMPWTAKVTVKVDDQFNILPGNGDISFDNGLQVTSTRCSITASPAGRGTLKVIAGRLIPGRDDVHINPAANPYDDSVPWPKFALRDIELKIDPGAGPTYSADVNCPRASQFVPNLYTFDAYWKIRHVVDGAPDRSGYVFTHWKVGNLSGVKSDLQGRSCQGPLCIVEQTTLELKPASDQ